MNAAIDTALVQADLAEATGVLSHLSAEQRETLDRARVRLMGDDATVLHALSLILDKQIRLPAYRWDAAIKSFDALARKAAERKLPAPVIEEVSRETITNGENEETWVAARILGAAPILNGWRCVATVTQLHDGCLLAHHATGEPHLNILSMHCDHCAQNRRRNMTFVLYHDEKNTEVQVGSTCLNEYLGTDALAAWFVWSRLHETVDTLAGWGDLYDVHEHAAWLADNATAATRKAPTQGENINPLAFVIACVAEIRVNGYVTSKQARAAAYSDSDCGPATGAHVWELYQSAEHVQPSEADHARAVEILAWVDTLNANERDEWTYEPTYLASLAISLRGSVSLYNANTAASAVQAYERELARRAEDGAWARGYAANTDDKIVIDLVVRKSIGWALACADAKGRQVLVKEHSFQTGERIEVGDTIRVSAIVGRCSVYRDVDQTILTRATVYRTTETLPAPVMKRAREQAEREGTEVPAWAVAPAKVKRSRKAA